MDGSDQYQATTYPNYYSRLENFDDFSIHIQIFDKAISIKNKHAHVHHYKLITHLQMNEAFVIISYEL